MAISLLSEFREFPFRSLADGRLIHKYNHDHETNIPGRYPRERFSDLPRRPFGGRIRRHVEVNRVSPLLAQRNKYEQQAEIQGPHYQKIDGHYLLNVVLQKRAPTLRGRLSLTRHILRDRRLTALHAQLQQLSMNPRCTHRGISFAHLPD